MILEALVKYVPSVAVIAVACIGFGELKSDVANLKILQQAQYDSVQRQLDNINTRLNQIQK